MTHGELTILIHKYLSGDASEEEKLKIEHWYESFEISSLQFEEGNPKKLDESFARSLRSLKEKIDLENGLVSKRAKSFRTSKGNLRLIYSIAAVTVIFLATGLFLSLWNREKKKPPLNEVVKTMRKDFQPGGNNAVLTLSNGSQVMLDSTGVGFITNQGETTIKKITNGSLAYHIQPVTDNRLKVVQYNTITTPRGGKYMVILSDGSKVWLNAASSLRFPAALTGKNREVEMTGEAYFEIAKNASMPFIVKKGDMEIKVLGTEFDVNAYDDEKNLKVTLVNGKVKVGTRSSGVGQGTNINQQAVLSAGQQALLSLSKDGTDKMKVTNDADINEAIAWKSDLFWFDNDDIQEVTSQLSRWYNINITIRGNIPDLFTGSIPRNLPFSKVFEVLQKTGSIQYKMVSDSSIVVMP